MRTAIVSYESRECFLREKKKENTLFWQFVAGGVSALAEVVLSTICYEAELIPAWLMWGLMVHALITVYRPAKRLLRFYEKSGR